MTKLKIGDWVKFISGKHKNKIAKIKLVRLKDNKIFFSNDEIEKNKKKAKKKNYFMINISNVIYFSTSYNITSKIHFLKVNLKKYRCLKKNSYILPK